jgi:hypothetical protein
MSRATPLLPLWALGGLLYGDFYLYQWEASLSMNQIAILAIVMLPSNTAKLRANIILLSLYIFGYMFRPYAMFRPGHT